MEKGIKIQDCPLTRFSGALHTQFHNQIFRLIDQWDVMLEVINVSDSLMKEWRGLIDTEIDINREVVASADTATLVELDRKRDDLITYLFATIRSSKRAPLAMQKEAATRLALIVDRYKGLQKESFDEETIHIDGLTHDLSKEQNLADMKSLGLDGVIGNLSQINEEYRTRRAQRTADRAASKLPAARDIRPQTDAVYARICQLIEVSYLICKQSADKDEIAKLADKINQQIAEIVTSHKQGQNSTTVVTPHRSRRNKEEENAE